MCRHCERRLSAQHTEWGCWRNPRIMSPEAVARRSAKGDTPSDGGNGKGPEGTGKGEGKGSSAKALGATVGKPTSHLWPSLNQKNQVLIS